MPSKLTNAMRPACAQHPIKIEVRRAKAVGNKASTGFKRILSPKKRKSPHTEDAFKGIALPCRWWAPCDSMLGPIGSDFLLLDLPGTFLAVGAATCCCQTHS